jgi:hypothetical protein
MQNQAAKRLLKVKLIVTSLFLLAFILSFSTLLQPPERISPEAFRAAYAALGRYRAGHPEETPRILAVVDFSKPSYVERMALVNLMSGTCSYYRVSHGKKTGMLYPDTFSNIPQSNMSSLGLYRVLQAYDGDHGKAMRLEGLDPGVNDSAFVRDIVLHSAGYVSPAYILLNLLTLNGPMIGRSNGCFVVSPGKIDEVTGQLASGAYIYAWADTTALRTGR